MDINHTEIRGGPIKAQLYIETNFKRLKLSVASLEQFIMVKIATLNVKGLNNRSKAQKTLTLLKSYNINIIMLQETNLKETSTRKFLVQQWGFDSLWSSKTTILVGKRNIFS